MKNGVFFSKRKHFITLKMFPLGSIYFDIRYKKDVLDTVYKEYSVAIKIAPFWYHTIWAYLTLVLLIILCLAGYICKLHMERITLNVWREHGLYRKDWEKFSRKTYW